jgi:hypothetical protein
MVGTNALYRRQETYATQIIRAKSMEKCHKWAGALEKKRSAVDCGALLLIDAEIYLNLAYIRRLGAFLALSDIKAHPVSFGQRFETITLDLGKVDEHVWSVVLFDKPKTLCIVEPLYCTFWHLLLHLSRWEFFVVHIPIAPKTEIKESRWVCLF